MFENLIHSFLELDDLTDVFGVRHGQRSQIFFFGLVQDDCFCFFGYFMFVIETNDSKEKFF